MGGRRYYLEENPEGWVLKFKPKPTNEWKEKPAFNPGKRVQIQQAYQRAFKDGRCLRCLGKGHRKAQCRELVRCFNCNALGHQSGWCNDNIPKPTKVEKPVKHENNFILRCLAFC